MDREELSRRLRRADEQRLALRRATRELLRLGRTLRAREKLTPGAKTDRSGARSS